MSDTEEDPNLEQLQETQDEPTEADSNEESQPLYVEVDQSEQLYVSSESIDKGVYAVSGTNDSTIVLPTPSDEQISSENITENASEEVAPSSEEHAKEHELNSSPEFDTKSLTPQIASLINDESTEVKIPNSYTQNDTHQDIPELLHESVLLEGGATENLLGSPKKIQVKVTLGIFFSPILYFLPKYTTIYVFACMYMLRCCLCYNVYCISS